MYITKIKLTIHDASQEEVDKLRDIFKKTYSYHFSYIKKLDKEFIYRNNDKYHSLIYSVVGNISTDTLINLHNFISSVHQKDHITYNWKFKKKNCSIK